VISPSSVPARRAFAPLGLAVIAISLGLWGVLRGGSAAANDAPAATAARGDLVVSVGGVGRIIQARASRPIATPAPPGGTSTASAPATPTEAPPDAVFPRTSGRVSRFLVAPGDLVVAGGPLALLDDGGAASAGVEQARNDLATAQVELRQKRTSDPLTGVPATPAERAAGRFAVTSAVEGLARLLSPPLAADVSGAWLEVRRAEADLETLLGGTPAERAEKIRIARQVVQVAQDSLNRTLAPADAADVSAASAELKKAEADLALLLRPPDSPLPEEVAAAQRAVTVARQNLEDAKSAVPEDPVAIRDAQLALDKAQADLAVLLRPPKGPLPEEIASARQTVDAARAKLNKLQAPPNPAEVRVARLELERATADLRKLMTGPSRAALAAARQAVEAARAKLKQLLAGPLTADVAASRLDVRRAQAELSVLRIRGGPGAAGDISLAQLKVDAARIRLAVARVNRRLLTVRAPSAGTVTALMTTRGAPVDTSTPLVTVADLHRLAVSVDLSEFDVAQVRPGLRAVVGVDALGGKSFPGIVLFAAPTGNDNGGVVTFPVRVGLSHAEGLRPGMNVSVRITVARRHDVLQVPLEAVTQDGGESTVTVIDESGNESARTVKLGLANNKSVQIVKGLRAGERVVLPEAQAPAGEE
jgi:multidrug efflux pump subunit AcrA (membrane-fusion protein)